MVTFSSLVSGEGTKGWPPYRSLEDAITCPSQWEAIVEAFSEREQSCNESAHHNGGGRGCGRQTITTLDETKNHGYPKSWLSFTGWQPETQNGTEMFDEIGQMLVPGALNDTKKIREASADIFANFGAGTPGKNSKT